jgi:hypothetical protein
MRHVLAALVMAGSLWITAGRADELSDQKRADIKALLKAAGGVASANEMVGPVTDQVLQTVKSARPDLQQDVLDNIRKTITETIREAIEAQGGLLDQLVPVYHAHLSQAEVKELITFYSSPIGRKFAAEQPKISREAYDVGVQWGKNLGPVVRQRVEAVIPAAPSKTPAPESSVPESPKPESSAPAPESTPPQ